MVLIHTIFIFFGLCFVNAATSKKYVAEGYIVFEDSTLDIYRPYDAVNAKRDMLHDSEYFFTFSNQLYATLHDYGLDIEIRFIKIDILDENVLSPRAGTDTLNKEDVLDQFQEWLEKTDARARLDYDFALLFSGKKLSGINGIASTGVMCKKDANPTTVITFGGQATAVTQAHEIGHIFGALHNGKEGHHVMRSQRSYDYMERFTFSKCSAFDIKQFLQRSGDTCLLDTKSTSWAPNVPPTKYRGRLFNEDQLCRQSYGPDSFACNFRKKKDKARTADEDTDCLFIYCQNPKLKSKLSCFRAQTPERMPCDHNKVCKLGKCVEDKSSKWAQKIVPGCMLGDQEIVYVDKKESTCAQAFEEIGPDMCKPKSYMQYKCCNFCAKKKISTSWGDCFGDAKFVRVDGDEYPCAASIPLLGINNLCTDPYGKKACCETCADRKISDDCFGDYDSVYFRQESLSCAESARKHGENYLCNDSYAMGRCCATCAAWRRGKRSLDSIPDASY